MLKRGDKVKIIGCPYVKDFTEAIIIGSGIEGFPTLVQFKKDSCTHFVENSYLFKENYLKERNMLNIDELIKNAMKSRNKTELLVYQAIKTEITNYKTAKNAKPYDEAAEISILKKMVKQREDSEKQYYEAGRKNLAIQEYNESEIIKKLLPEPVDESDIHSALCIWCEEKGFIEDFYNEENSIDMISYQIPKKEMGNAIKYLKLEFPQADGKMISEIVKEYLL